MKIGIDLDDTLVNTSEAFDNVLKKYDVDFKKSYSEDWTDEEAEFILTNYFEEVVKSAKVRENAKEVIDYLNSLGHELYVITARSNYYSKNMEKITLDFIKSNDLKISNIYFNQAEKSKLASELNIDIMIDDNINVYKNMIKNNIDCILFGDEIKTWDDIKTYIDTREDSYGKINVRRKNL